MYEAMNKIAHNEHAHVDKIEMIFKRIARTFPKWTKLAKPCEIQSRSMMHKKKKKKKKKKEEEERAKRNENENVWKTKTEKHLTQLIK